MSAWQLPPAVRDLCSKHPEMHDLEAWELPRAILFRSSGISIYPSPHGLY
jgi:hypothetical protein